MSVLSAAERKSLKTSDFALPKERAYPIHDTSHARDALSRVSQYGTPEEQAKVRAAVRKRYPKIDAGNKQMTPNEVPSR
jgi:hypothetical protein